MKSRVEELEELKHVCNICDDDSPCEYCLVYQRRIELNDKSFEE